MNTAKTENEKNLITKKELDAQAKMLAESQQKFVTSAHMMCDTVNALEKYIQAPRYD